MLFSPAVGPLFWLLFVGIILCSFELCSLSGVAVCECVSLAPRAPCTHRLRSVVPWFVKGLHVLTHVFSSVRFFTCCSWSGGTPHHSLSSPPPAARVEVVVSRALVHRWEHLVAGACASKVCIANGELYLLSGFALLGSRDRPQWSFLLLLALCLRSSVWAALVLRVHVAIRVR